MCPITFPDRDAQLRRVIDELIAIHGEGNVSSLDVAEAIQAEDDARWRTYWGPACTCSTSDIAWMDCPAHPQACRGQMPGPVIFADPDDGATEHVRIAFRSRGEAIAWLRMQLEFLS
jgi:hypothetical protein